MKSIIFLLGVCTFLCVAYAFPMPQPPEPAAPPAPLSFQTLNQLQNLLDKIADKQQSMDSPSGKTLAESLDQAMESLNERARAEYDWGSLAKHAIGLLGK